MIDAVISKDGNYCVFTFKGEELMRGKEDGVVIQYALDYVHSLGEIVK